MRSDKYPYKRLMTIERSRAMFSAEKLAERFKMAVMIEDAHLEEVALWVLGEANQEVPDKDLGFMEGFLEGLFTKRKGR